jgi:hypothetical protein
VEHQLEAKLKLLLRKLINLQAWELLPPRLVESQVVHLVLLHLELVQALKLLSS